jgi:biopolymer transport protein ExbD
MASTSLSQIEIKPQGSRPPFTVVADDCKPLAIDIVADRVTLKLDTATRDAAEITTTDDVSYEELIATMDLAMSAGFIDVGLSARDQPAAKPTAPAPATIRPTGGPDALKDAPVIAVTRSAVLVDSVEIARVDQDVTAAVAGALAKKTRRDGVAILQADVASSMKTINQVIVGAKQSGFDNLLFAVKNKP